MSEHCCECELICAATDIAGLQRRELDQHQVEVQDRAFSLLKNRFDRAMLPSMKV